MPTITRLTTQKKDPQRINIFLDGEYSFAIDLETVTRHQLKPNKELTSEQVQALLHEGEIQRVYNLTLELFSRRPRSEQELDQWFYKKEVPRIIQDHVKQKLRSLNLLNDHDFAVWWVDQRLNHRPKGPSLLRAELQAKGISSAIVKQVLTDLPTNTAAIHELASKKLRALSRYDLPQQRTKLQSFLARRGYTWTQIKPIIDELLSKSYTS